MNKITESVVESLAISIILCYDNSITIMNGQVIPMFKGSYVALVTPFHEDGSVYSLEDYQAIAGKDKVRPVKATMPDWYLKSLEEYRK